MAQKRRKFTRMGFHIWLDTHDTIVQSAESS